MQVKAQDLPARLTGALAPVYFISGDETLLVEEAADAILETARAAGFSERTVLHAEGSFDWHTLLAEGASMSLFADRKILDVRNPAGAFDKGASEALRAYCDRPPEDTLLLLRSGRIDGRQKSSAWFKALDAAGVVIQIWPIGLAELPRWLQGRLSRAGISLAPEALTYLAERVEGNLLAAVQEIEKLRLANLAQPVSLAALGEVLEDSAHYDVFELLDAVMRGETGRIPRMVRGLRAEGVALFAVLGALTSQLRQIAEGRVPQFKRRTSDALVKRLGSPAAIDRVLAQCALVDQQGKGQLLGDAWLSLEDLLLRLAGTRLPSLERQLEVLKRP
ncbi:MAG TPA: DNA polymerase III subunit delta [Pseudomonadales bacterium]